MSLANLMEEYKNDVTKELMTDEAKRALALRVEEIQTRAKAEIERALLEVKEEEKHQIAKCRAEEVARQFAEYREAGLSDDRAWELVKQEAGMIQWGILESGENKDDDTVRVVRCKDCTKRNLCVSFRESGNLQGYCYWAQKVSGCQHQ